MTTSPTASTTNRPLLALGLLTAGFGVLAALAGSFEWAASAFVWMGGWGRLDPALTPAGRLAFGLAGGAFLGWGVTLAGLAERWREGPTRERLTGPILVALGAWFVADSGGSIAAGAWPNAINNLGFLGWGVWALTRR